MELDWFGEPGAYTETDWSPNANGIYAQTITCLLLTFGHYSCSAGTVGTPALDGVSQPTHPWRSSWPVWGHGFAGRTAL